MAARRGSGAEGDDAVARAAVAVFAKLKAVGCPSLDGLCISEPSTILDLLCSPSKYRLEILEWMCSRLCPSWQDQLGLQKGVPAEVKVQEMARLGQDLLLCGPDDQELLKGRACAPRQLHFMDQLLDAVQALSAGRGGGCSAEQHLEDACEKNEALLEELFFRSRLRQLLTPDCDPWPLDVQPVLEQQNDARQGARPPAEPGKDKGRELSRQLQESATRLQALRAQCLAPTQVSGAVVPGADVSTLDQWLRLVISDFHQLVGAFLQVCEDQLGECCQRPGANTHTCGPAIQAVHQTLTACGQLLKAVMAVTDTSAQAAEAVQQQGRRASRGSSAPSLASKLEELARKYQVFPGGPRRVVG